MHRKSIEYSMGIVATLCVMGMMVGCGQKAIEKVDSGAKLKEAMVTMKDSAAKLGVPSLSEDTLVFGTTKMNDNYEIVDALQKQYGCTATFFVKRGEKFIRITTNVMKDGKRALGTELDPEGPVIKSIRKGEVFYGGVDILGSQYDTGYEPIKNAASEIIGVYYVGYQL